MRKIIQIAFDSFVSSENAYDSSEITSVTGGSTLFALCDDGSVWFEGAEDNWKRYEINEIPQD